MLIIGSQTLWIFDVHVNGFEETEEIDVTAPTEAEAWKLAKAEAEDLYVDYNLTLRLKI